MNTLKKYTCGLLLVGVLVMPHAASAQTPDQIRLTLLKQMVVLLQKQLTLLLEQAERQSVNQTTPQESDFIDKSVGNGGDIKATYAYRGDRTTVASIPVSLHRDFYDRVLDLAPEELKENLSALIVYDGSTEVSDGYVDAEVNSNGDFFWRFGVNEQFLRESVGLDIRDELIVHELGHIVAFQDGLDIDDSRVCHSAVKEGGFCPNPDSYYGQFIEKFWTDKMLDEVDDSYGYSHSRSALYRMYPNKFVSDYAAVSPHEDFAESFAYSVLYEDLDDGTMAEDKQEFFDAFSSTRAFKNEILTDL